MVQADWAFVFDFNDDDGHRLGNLVAHQIGGRAIGSPPMQKILAGAFACRF
jgi:hypothetical protein